MRRPRARADSKLFACVVPGRGTTLLVEGLQKRFVCSARSLTFCLLVSYRPLARFLKIHVLYSVCIQEAHEKLVARCF